MFTFHISVLFRPKNYRATYFANYFILRCNLTTKNIFMIRKFLKKSDIYDFENPPTISNYFKLSNFQKFLQIFRLKGFRL